MVSSKHLTLEYEAWETAAEPFHCQWCHAPIGLLDTYWAALFNTEGGFVWWRVCTDCAAVGPPLEEVLP